MKQCFLKITIILDFMLVQLLSQSVPRVLRLFGQRLVVRRDPLLKSLRTGLLHQRPGAQRLNGTFWGTSAEQKANSATPALIWFSGFSHPQTSAEKRRSSVNSNKYRATKNSRKRFYFLIGSLSGGTVVNSASVSVVWAEDRRVGGSSQG